MTPIRDFLAFRRVQPQARGMCTLKPLQSGRVIDGQDYFASLPQAVDFLIVDSLVIPEDLEGAANGFFIMAAL